jgi:hypothetical protein
LAIRAATASCIEADNQTRTAEELVLLASRHPDDLRNALITIRADVRTNVSQVGFDVVMFTAAKRVV